MNSVLNYLATFSRSQNKKNNFYWVKSFFARLLGLILIISLNLLINSFNSNPLGSSFIGWSQKGQTIFGFSLFIYLLGAYGASERP